MNWRLVTGFVLAPLVPCALFVVAMSAMAGQWNGFMFGVVASLAVAESLIVILAIPMFLVIRRFRPVGLAECLWGGALVAILFNAIGFLITVALDASEADVHGLLTLASATTLQSLLGAAIGACFWAMAIRGTNGA